MMALAEEAPWVDGAEAPTFTFLPVMKRALLTLLLIGCLLSLGACMFMGPDDKEFFGKGWVNPKELDGTPSPHMPVRPSADQELAPIGEEAPAPVRHPSSSSDDWSTPSPH